MPIALFDRRAQTRQHVRRHAPAFLHVREARQDELVDAEAPVRGELVDHLSGIAHDRRAEVHADLRDAVPEGTTLMSSRPPLI